MSTKRRLSLAKENKNPAPDDLDDFVLAKPGPSKKARFATPLSETKMMEIQKGPVVPNTEKSTAWALRTFTDWRNERNKQPATGDQCPTDLLENPEAEKLNFWLSRVVIEARRKDGEPYPARTLYLLLAGLLRYGRSKSKLCPNFMDKSDVRFSELSGVCETVSRQLRKEGVGASVKHASIITPEEENLLLEKGVIGIYAPKPLVRAVFFYAGKAFCLRGGGEQRALKPSQFVRGYNPDRYTYTENGSKNHRGGFGTLNDSNKIVTVYSTLDKSSGDPVRDIVYLLDLYFSNFLSLLTRWTLCTCNLNRKYHQILKSHGSTHLQWERTAYTALFAPCAWKRALKRKNPTTAFAQQGQQPCLQLRFQKK